MKKMFVSEDGRQFESEKECLEHESKNKDKEKRYNEVIAAREHYYLLLKSYREDYCKDDWLDKVFQGIL